MSSLRSYMPACAGPCLMACGALIALTLDAAQAHNCKCRNRGVLYELGETSCLRVDGRSYLARCEMKLNVSSWTEIQGGCPTAAVTAAPQSAAN